jgi:nucleoside-triphosphatase
MRLRYEKTLITGKPGVGKTTLAQKVIERMRSVQMAGFYTAEIRPTGCRLGFELHGLNGKRQTLAHVKIQSPYRVGKYGVDKDGFEEFLGALDLMNKGVKLIVIDEIGKMELFSNRFRSLVCEVLDSHKQVIASIAIKGNEFIQKIKQRSDIRVIEVTHGNRDQLVYTIVDG